MPRVKKMPEEKPQAVKASSKKDKFFAAVGRRKRAVASVFLYPRKGDFLVNGAEIDGYFPGERDRFVWRRPFHLTGTSHPSSSYSATVKVFGSGKPSQAQALALAFSRALVESNQELRPVLRASGLLTRDPREVERKKPFLRKARKRPQYSKR